MNPTTTQSQGIDMETLTLDVQGVPEEKINYLRQLVELWKRQDKVRHEKPEEEDDVKPSDFVVKHSNVKGGIVTREMAYE